MKPSGCSCKWKPGSLQLSTVTLMAMLNNQGRQQYFDAIMLAVL